MKNAKRILRRFGYIDENNKLTEKAFSLVSKNIIKDLNRLIIGKIGFGTRYSNYIGKSVEWFSKKYSIYDNYSDINTKKSVRNYITKKTFIVEKMRENKKGNIVILLDVSGSMFGEKIIEAKKAVTALTKLIEYFNDKISIILFNDKIIGKFLKIKRASTIDKKIISIIPNGGTDISIAIKEAIKISDKNDLVILITDALPTYGEKPLEDTINSAKILSNKGVNLLIIGIKLNKEGIENAKKIIKVSGGELYVLRSSKKLGRVLISKYLSYRMFKR